MASLSPNLLLMLLAYGESSAYGYTNWGDLTNANLEIVEDKLTEISAITVDAADVTLTDAQQQTGILNLSGTLTGNRSIVTLASKKGWWFVINGTSGAFSVTVKPSGGSGVTVTQGTTAIVYTDGSTATTLGVYSSSLAGFLLKTAPTGTVVGTSDSQTLSAKTIEAGTFTNGYTEEVYTANTGTSLTIDLANGSIQVLTLTGNCAYTFPTATAGRSFFLIQKQDGTGGRTVTWDAAVKWPSATAPTLTSTASKADIFAFTADGTYWLGRTVGQVYY